MRELHLTAKDFRLEWFSGTGKGGQHRNKHQNCCRITHIETGLSAQGTGSRSRVDNQRDAFNMLARRILSYYEAIDNPQVPRASSEVVRNYHGVRNEVLDKASGEKRLYRDVVEKGDLGPLIEARATAMGGA